MKKKYEILLITTITVSIIGLIFLYNLIYVGNFIWLVANVSDGIESIDYSLANNPNLFFNVSFAIFFIPILFWILTYFYSKKVKILEQKEINGNTHSYNLQKKNKISLWGFFLLLIALASLSLFGYNIGIYWGIIIWIETYFIGKNIKIEDHKELNENTLIDNSTEKNKISLWGFILSLIAMITSLSLFGFIGIFLGIIGIIQIKTNKQKGIKLAIAAIIIGTIFGNVMFLRYTMEQLGYHKYRKNILCEINSFKGCKKNKLECKTESYFIASYYNGKGEERGSNLIIFNICDSLLKLDTINMSAYNYDYREIENCYISFNLPGDYDLKKIESLNIYYATIWSDKPNVSQFLQLKKIFYNQKRDLQFYNPRKFVRKIFMDSLNVNSVTRDKIEDDYKVFIKAKNLIYYPNYFKDKLIMRRFKNVSKKNLENAIHFELDKKNKYLETKENINEMNTWLSYVNRYKKGDFKDNNQIFSIDRFELYLKLFIVKDGNNIEKILKFNIVVGN